MNKEQIIALVSEVTGVSAEAMKLNSPTTALFARYVSVVILHEEGYSPVDIAPVFDGHRTNVYSTLKTVNSLLETNKAFKKMYLDCIARLSEMEDAA